MKQLQRNILVLQAFLIPLQACYTPAEPNLEADLGKADTLRASAPLLPQPNAAPWGGEDSKQWTPESVIANAVSTELNEQWADDEVVDVIVATPIKMQGSDLHPYGDGQSNAAPIFPYWEHSKPPVIATLSVHADGSETMGIRFHPSLTISDNQVQLEIASDTAHLAVPLQGQVDGAGGLVVHWTPTQSLRDQESPPLLWVRPQGWDAGFPLHFYIPTTDVDAIVDTMHPSDRDFGQGRSLPDPEGIKSTNTLSSFDNAMTEHRFGLGYNQEAFHSSNVHGEFPRHDSTSAVGQSWAWVAQAPSVPFKHVYLCFEGRRPDLESLSGAPSGSGYHHIGDPAETLANTLESSPFLVSWAAEQPTTGTVFAGYTAAYGLDTVTTSRLLWPKEALVTSHGGTGPFASRPTYHWYAFHQAAPVCAEIWVHDCPSNASLDFSCEAETSSTVGVETTTSFGQNVFLVGSTPALGSWNPNKALPLSADSYPLWSLSLPQGQSGEFKFIKKFGDMVEWEPGPNHSLESPETHHYSWQ